MFFKRSTAGLFSVVLFLISKRKYPDVQHETLNKIRFRLIVYIVYSFYINFFFFKRTTLKIQDLVFLSTLT